MAVDASADMVAAAKACGVDARVMDGEALTFEADFDALFSNAALHWMRRPDAVIAGMRRALKPGGRLVAEFGGGDNVATVKDALIDGLNRRGLDGMSVVPWYFPSDGEYRARLEARGFTGDDIAASAGPRTLPGPLAAEAWGVMEGVQGGVDGGGGGPTGGTTCPTLRGRMVSTLGGRNTRPRAATPPTRKTCLRDMRV